uniref:hypothetical protein n=1 Tax=Sphingomonas sp. CFBP 13706 TaxID=2775314 RepID=UPI001FD1FBD0|nr:hypothetical protein [Sphingomonas sp. CFBP 13706]
MKSIDPASPRLVDRVVDQARRESGSSLRSAHEKLEELNVVLEKQGQSPASDRHAISSRNDEHGVLVAAKAGYADIAALVLEIDLALEVHQPCPVAL